MKQIRKRLTYANVMSSLAVFLVLGGATAFAATQDRRQRSCKANSVTTGKIKKEAVTAAKIKNSAITTSKIADKARHRRQDRSEPSLGTVPSADAETRPTR